MKIERGRKVEPSCWMKSESIQVLNKAEGGLGRAAKLSLDISCQHFITVAVIKRWRPWYWPRQAKLHLGWKDKPPAATAAAAEWLQEGTGLSWTCTHFNQFAKKSQTSHYIYVIVILTVFVDEDDAGLYLQLDDYFFLLDLIWFDFTWFDSMLFVLSEFHDPWALGTGGNHLPTRSL